MRKIIQNQPSLDFSPYCLVKHEETILQKLRNNWFKKVLKTLIFFLAFFFCRKWSFARDLSRNERAKETGTFGEGLMTLYSVVQPNQNIDSELNYAIMTEPTWRPHTELYKYQFMSVILANTSSAENPTDLL